MTDSKNTLFLYHHTHWDREWYWPFRRYQLRLANVIDDLLDQLDNDQLPYFTLDGQTALIEDYLELRPDQQTRLSQHIKNGKISIGPWFVMPDEFLVSGESLIRNLQLGIEQSKALGCDKFTGYLPDTFGHSSHIPTILQGFGINSAMVWRGVNPPHNEFRWQSPDGSEVLGYYLSNGYFQNTVHDPNLPDDEKEKALSRWINDGFAKNASQSYLLPIGGDHLGLLDKSGHQWLKQFLNNGQYKTQTTTTVNYMTHLQTATNQSTLQTINGELIDNTSAFLLPGVWSSRLYLKQANRIAEHWLTHKLEPLLAMAATIKPLHPTLANGLDLAWKNLMLNHPHDSICGCSVDEVHRANEVRFDEVISLTQSLFQQVQKELTHTEKEESSTHWIITHTGERPYSGVIPVTQYGQDKETAIANITQVEAVEESLLNRYETELQEVPQAHLTQTKATGWIFAEDIAPHAITSIPKTASRATTPVTLTKQTDGYTFDNGVLNVEVTNKHGIIAHYQKRSHPIGHQLMDWQDNGDSYNSGPVLNDMEKTAQLDKIIVHHKGPLVCSLVLTYTLDTQTFITEITLKAASPLLEFKTNFKNTEPDHKLQVQLNTTKPVSEVWAEGHLGIVKRHYDPTYHEKNYLPAEKFKELKTNTGPIQRFIMANDQLLITEGLTEYEVQQENILLTLHRAFGSLSKPETGVRGAQAGPPFKTPEGQGINRQFSYRYGWSPLKTHHNNIGAAYTLSHSFCGVISGETGLATEKKLLSWDNPHIVRSALKPLKDSILLRVFNTTAENQTMNLTPHFTSTTWTALNLAEDPTKPLEPNSPIHFGPYEVKNIQVS